MVSIFREVNSCILYDRFFSKQAPARLSAMKKVAETLCFSHSKLVMGFPRKSLAPVSPKVGLKEDFYHSLFHRWEQQDITDGCCISEKHAETVDTDSESTCWWHTVFKGFNVVVVDACCFVITEFFSSSLCFET